jgi:RND superfamily putative drug exporter
MFPILGAVVSRGWPVFLVGWLLLMGWASLVAPAWDEVAASGQFSFLPKDVPSNRGKELLQRAFPEDIPSSNIVLVLSRDDSHGIQEADRDFISTVLKPALRDLSETAKRRKGETGTGSPAIADSPFRPFSVSPDAGPVTRIRSLEDKGDGELLKSADNKATLVIVELAGEFLSSRDWPTIEKVEHIVEDFRRQEKVPQGLDIHLTGNAVIGRDVRQAEAKSADAIGRWTVILVIGLLLVIYRAPLLALIPLATVFIATEFSLKLLAILAQRHYLQVSDTIRIYITVLCYGAGVDYCLFLIARHREEVERGVAIREAVANAVGNVGGGLAASAGTVICGIGMLAFAQFGKYHQAGICIPLSLMVVLASALTFTPTLLRLTGSWAFWPKRPAPEKAIGQGQGHGQRHGNGWERIAEALLARPGTIWLASMAVMAPFVVIALLHYQQVDYGINSELPKGAPSSVGLEVLKQHFPAGTVGPLTVLISNQNFDFGALKSYPVIRTLSETLERQRDSLELADIRSLAFPLGITPHGKEALTSIAVSTPVSGEAVRHLSFVHYVSTAPELNAHVTRVDLVSRLDPLSQESIDNLTNLQEAFRAALPGQLADSQLDFVGPMASLRDLSDVTRDDFKRIEMLVPAVVFVILVVLLRKVVVSLYLIATVVVSFLATLGVAFLVFWLANPAEFIGLDWKVPVFLFTILVAVGEDYNIFLLARVHEEEREHGPLHGVTAALVKTGGVISSCGFIMAGTFAALLSGSLIEMKQLGFALAFGILLDTLVVRSIVVPAFLIWLRRGKEHESSG